MRQTSNNTLYFGIISFTSKNRAERPIGIPRRLAASSCRGAVWGPPSIRRQLHCLFTPSRRAILDPATGRRVSGRRILGNAPGTARVGRPTTATRLLGHRGSEHFLTGLPGTSAQIDDNRSSVATSTIYPTGIGRCW